MTIFALTGSPSERSRSSVLLRHVVQRLSAEGLVTQQASLLDIPAADLIGGNYASPAAHQLREQIHAADVVIISTPVYKASIAGGLKAVLDLFNENSLADKLILPLVSGGTPAHLLSLEYSFKPILSALGARHILTGVYATEEQVHVQQDGQAFISDAIRTRLDEAAQILYHFVAKRHVNEAALAV